MKKKISILFYSILFYSMNMMAQIPTPVAPNTTVDQQIRTCLTLGTGNYKLFAVAMQNECGAWLNGYPFTVKGLTGASPLEITNANTATICTKVWGFRTMTYGNTPSSYTIRPGYANTIWRGNAVLCCPVDTLPGNSPDATVGLNFTTFTPAQQTYTPSGSGGFVPFPTYTFTVTNPYAPVYTVQGKNIDMVHTEFIKKCNVGSTTEIPITNSTNTFGTSVQYKVTVYNSDVNRTVGSVAYPGIWQSTVNNYLEQYTSLVSSLVGGNYYVFELSVRSGPCANSTGNGAYVRGHFRYLTAATTESSNFKLLPYIGGGNTNYNRVTAITPYNSLPAQGPLTGGITGVYTTGYVTDYRVRIQQVNCSTGATLITLVDNTLNSINGAIPDSKYFAEYAMDPDGIGVGSTVTQTNYFNANYNTIKNNCYKVTVNTISGGCGNTSADVWSYFRIAQATPFCPNCRTTNDKNDDADIKSKIVTTALSVYPNPVDNVINFDLSSSKEESVLVQIFSLDGKELKGITIPIIQGNNKIEFSSEDLLPGMYLYRVKTSDKEFNGKIIKK